MSSRTGAAHTQNGFTLIEIMVVLIISVGLIVLMSGLYRAVGNSAIALRGGRQEWALQHQLREQLAHIFRIPDNTFESVSGETTEIYLTSWHGEKAAADGRPMLAYYHYDSHERTLYYQEHPLPPWWSPVDIALLKKEVRTTPEKKLLTGVEELTFSYLPMPNLPASALATPDSQWRKVEMPGLIQVKFIKAGRHFSFWLDTRVTDA